MMLSTLKKAVALMDSQLDGKDIDVCIAVNGSEPVSITGGIVSVHKTIPNKSIVVLYG